MTDWENLVSKEFQSTVFKQRELESESRNAFHGNTRALYCVENDFLKLQRLDSVGEQLI